MTGKPGRRLLFAAPTEDGVSLAPLRTAAQQQGWELWEAGSLGRARFLLQHVASDALLLDEGLLRREGQAGLSWLAGRAEVPVFLLAEGEAGLVAEALRAGVRQWLPRERVLKDPELLVAALDGVADRAERPAERSPREGQASLGRLIDLLWEATPVSGGSRWLTQRHTLERLEEEVARAERHSTPLSLVLAEAAPAGEAAPSAAVGARLAAAVRRSDVAGRYGPDGFLLLLPNTPEDGAQICCRRLQGLVGRLPAQVWFGVAGHSARCRTPAALLGCAEGRLERARRQPAGTP